MGRYVTNELADLTHPCALYPGRACIVAPATGALCIRVCQRVGRDIPEGEDGRAAYLSIYGDLGLGTLCLADVAGYGACVREPHDGTTPHRDANGYEFESITTGLTE